MSTLVKNIIRFMLFIGVQVYILNQFIVPYLYFLYILWLPFGLGRFPLMLIAFFFGLSFDYFTGTMGLHAAACVMIAYIRPFLLSLLIPKESTEQSYVEPSISSMGWAPYSLYVGLLTFIHHFYLVLLEWLQFGSFVYFLGKVTATTGVSLMLIFVTEMLFSRKAKFRTNK